MNYETSVTADHGEPIAGSLSEAGYGEKRSSKWKIVLIILALALVGGIVGFLMLRGGEGGAVPADGDESQAPAVTVVSPGQATIEGQISATGTLAARREMPVGVAGEGGRVVSVPVDAGDWVRQGQVLVVIDRSVQNQQVASAAASVQVARADAQLAQANLDRALKLVDRGFISKADVDRLTATRDSAVARVRVSEAQAAELRARSARLNVTAPAAGLVLQRNVEPGQVVSAGSGTLFSIAKGGEVELLAQVGETELKSISAGVEAQVTPVGTDQSFTGQVWQVSPVIDPQNRQGIARIALSYAPGLRPGGFASATINSGTLVAPMLPESAILSDDEGSFVYVIDKDNKAQRRGVETGLVTTNGIAVTGGLDGTEKVVLRAGGFLTEGETVVPKMQDGG